MRSSYYKNASHGVLVLALSLMAMGPIAGQARAADVPRSGVTVSDVVVTARRREERLEKVPISVAVVSADTMRRQNITGMQDVQYLTPSLNVSTNTARSSNNYTLRGQGTTYGTEPSVVAYFADVPVPGGGNGNAALFDLGSVQVLNGPQGTLFGRNAVGGAVLFTPARPLNDFGGHVSAGLGNYNNRQGEAVVNLPLVPDKLLLRVGIGGRTRKGFTRDYLNGRDYDDVNVVMGRASLLFTPSSAVSNLLIFNFTRSHETGTGTVLSLVNPNGLAASIFPQLATLAATQAQLGPRQTAQTPGIRDAQKMIQVVNTTNVQLGDHLKLKNIASFSAFRQNIVSDVSGSPLPVLSFLPVPGWGGPQNNNQPAIDQITEEPQFSGDIGDKAFDWTLGGYFQKIQPKHSLQSLQAFGGPAVLTDRGINLTAFAFYGQGTFDLGRATPRLDGLKFTAGYRYSQDHRRDYTNSYVQAGTSFTGGGACALIPGTPPPSYPNCQIDFAGTFAASTYTLALDYQLTRHMMAYVTARSGFKSGGFNLGAPLEASVSTFQPEKVKDVEVGIKINAPLGNRANVQFNIDVFRDNYSNIQRPLLKSFPDGVVTVYVVNAASATIRGIEATSALTLSNGLSFAAAYSYTDSRYGNFLTEQGEFTNFPLPYTPKTKLSLSANYKHELNANKGSLRIGANYIYQSSYRNLDVLDPDVSVPGYGLLNLTAGWENIMGSPVGLELFARNVTDKLYVIGKGDYYYSLGFTTNVYGEPRMFGGSLTYHF